MPVSYTHLTVDRRCLRPEDVSNDEKLSLNNNNYTSLAIL